MLAAFAVDDFNVHAWVNEACAKRSEGESLERYLAELEMRLHLLAEDLDAAIEDESARALLRVPSAVQEVSHLKADASNLKVDVERTLQALAISADAAEQNVATLAALDQGKSNMEQACSTLKEATDLADMFQRVDSVFASGNLQRVATMLATMRRGLVLVGNIPEFEGGEFRLQALEERFKSLLEPQLSSAFASRNGEMVQQLSELLDGVGESSAVNRMYNSSAASFLQKVWEKYDSRRKEEAVWEWLPLLQDDVSSALGSEVKWTLHNLPDHYPAIVISLLQTFASKHQQQLAHHMTVDIQQVRPQQALEQVGKLLASYSRFLSDVQAKLSSALPEDLLPLWATFYDPLFTQLSRYGEFENKLLSSQLSTMLDSSPSEAGTQGVIADLQKVIDQAIQCVQAAAQRCIRLTQSAELGALIATADRCLATFVASLEAKASDLADEVLQKLSRNPSQSSLETSSMLPLVGLAERLQSQIAIQDARFRGHISDLQDEVSKQFGGQERLTPAFLRLQSPDGLVRQSLLALTANLEDSRFSSLPEASAAAKAFSDAIKSIVFNLLMHKLRAELGGVAQLEVWAQEEPENKYNLPSFSAYPQSYATAGGEYLMMLPQVLEVLMVHDNDNQPEAALDGDWLDKVAIGAADALVEQLSGITRLTKHGSTQLAADLEYFCNVLHALGVAVPATLGTWQLATQWTDEDFVGAFKQAQQDGVLDKATALRVASIRHLPLSDS